MALEPARERATMAEHQVSAEELSDDITHAVGHSWFFDPHTILVAIDGGHVTLKGTVRSERERKMRAAAAAWSRTRGDGRRQRSWLSG